MNNFESSQYSDSFATAQDIFEGEIEASDRSKLVTVGSSDIALSTFHESPQNSLGFHELTFSPNDLHVNPVFTVFIGRVLLMPNQRMQSLSPAIIMPYGQDKYEITMLDQPFDPRAGFTKGQHFGLSAKAQTRTTGFGMHGRAGAFEAGHFGTVLLGARQERVGDAIRSQGDTATHNIIGKGVPEAMQGADMLPVAYRTSILSSTLVHPIKAFWHPSLNTESGPQGGDYPDAVRLMLGAAVAALGTKGLGRAQRLVSYAQQGI